MGAASNCKEYYRRLHSSCGEILTQSFAADTQGVHSASHSFVLDFETWLDALSTRPELNLLRAALHEYQLSLLSVVQGQYRQAFMGLRFFMELALGAILFSSDELELRLWMRGERDIVWASLLDQDAGLFSQRFVRVFNDSLVDEALHYRGMAGQLYRDCSEFVHGNVQTHAFLPTALEFDEDVFFEWHGKAQTARLVVSFALCTRYLGDLDETSRNALEPIVSDELGHIEAVRAFFGGATEVS